MLGDAGAGRTVVDRETRVWRDLGLIIGAHVAGLAELGMLDDETAAALLDAVERVAAGEPPAGHLLDQLAVFDQRLAVLTPAGVAGAARVGRQPPEVLAAVHRLCQRDDLLDLAERLHRVWREVIELASVHVTTLMPVYAGAHPMQPSTLGHWLGGVIGPLGRASRRLLQLVETIDASPMGAGALASAGLGVDREAIARRLGFASVHVNTFDAIVAVDGFGDGAAVVESVAAIIDRFLAALAVWFRTAPPGLSLADSWLTSGDLPHLRRSPRFDALQTAARSTLGAAARARTAVAAMSYELDLAASDDLLDCWAAAFTAARALLDGVSELLSGGLQVNRAFLANRAAKDLTTIGDLADLLMIDEGVDPAAAFQIAELVAGQARERGLDASAITVEMIDGAALLTLGREIKVEFENISRYLAPRRFLERRGATGGPAPDAIRQWLDRERLKLGADVRVVAGVRRRIAEAATAHRATIEEAVNRVASG